MAEQFVSEIRIFAGNFAPRGWALCNGQLMSIAQNQALFSLLGNTYGGDGQTTFALPDLRGRVPMHFGDGPGLTPRSQGEKFGATTITLTDAQIPMHTHQLTASSADATTDDPMNNVLSREAQSEPETELFLGSSPGDEEQLNAAVVASDGGGQPHNNMMPFTGINYVISLVGVFPSRN